MRRVAYLRSFDHRSRTGVARNRRRSGNPAEAVGLGRTGIYPKDDRLSQRMRAAPHNADIGLVGKAKDKYTLFLGGHKLGTRLNYIYKDLVPGEKIVSELIAVFKCFQRDRLQDETLGDFCHRLGKDELLSRAEPLLTAAVDVQPE